MIDDIRGGDEVRMSPTKTALALFGLALFAAAFWAVVVVAIVRVWL